MNAIPLWVVAGLLGAGKTTLLRRLARATAGQGLAFVVNEFAAVDVDAAAVERAGGQAFVVSGGSVFGRFRASDFARVLERVADGVPALGGDIISPSGVVVEASCLSDPRSLPRLLAETGLDARFHVAGVTAVIDPRLLTWPLLALPNIRGQVESADLVLLNKADVRDERTIEAMQRKLGTINPDARVLRCVGAAVAPSILLAESVRCRAGLVDAAFGCRPDYGCAREWVAFSRPVAQDELALGLDALGDDLCRAQGIVRTTGGWKALAWHAGALSAADAGTQAESSLALIWRPSEDGARHLKRIRRCG
ncbi:MAG: hypothetical protein H6816_15625 [Phycisphaerales bacterium]|nr:hypothetical protein [Phycisphaerales bacterium]